jgi:hypothetical protein
MNRSKLVLPLAVSLLAAGLASATAFGASIFVPGSQGPGQLKTTAVGTKHKLQGTFFDSSNYAGVSLPGYTLVPIGALANLNCTNSAGCTLGAELMAQIAPTGSQNPWAICINVDNVLQSCPWTAETPAATSVYTTENTRYNFAVPLGNHTMQMVLFSSNSSTLAAYEAAYRLYKP